MARRGGWFDALWLILTELKGGAVGGRGDRLPGILPCRRQRCLLGAVLAVVAIDNPSPLALRRTSVLPESSYAGCIPSIRRF